MMHALGGIFAVKYDLPSPRRRLQFENTTPRFLEQELRRRFRVLEYAKCGTQPNEDQLVEIFATAYLMLTENRGQNFEQLVWANVPGVVDAFIRNTGAFANGSLPEESTALSLAINISWRFMSDRKKFVCFECAFLLIVR
jgi:hypothetical protein